MLRSVYLVSIPFRYAENPFKVTLHPDRLEVSIPFRYAENFKYFPRMHQRCVFQFLLGTLKTYVLYYLCLFR